MAYFIKYEDLGIEYSVSNKAARTEAIAFHKGKGGELGPTYYDKDFIAIMKGKYRKDALKQYGEEIQDCKSRRMVKRCMFCLRYGDSTIKGCPYRVWERKRK